MKNNTPRIVVGSGPQRASVYGFTLVELLVVIAIIAVLAALGLSAMQRVKKSAATARSISAMKTVLEANTLYSADNEGQINILKWKSDPLEANPAGQWVAATFWGRLQPYLFPDIESKKPKLLRDAMEIELENLFGCTFASSPTSKTVGGTFDGAPVFRDTSGLPVPFGFNSYLDEWNKWTRQLQVERLPSVIYLTYGFGHFDEVDAQTYREMPTDKEKDNNIYYLPSESAIMGFLDGHIEQMTPPIDERHIKFDGAHKLK